MTHTSTEQPEALPTGRELAVMLSQGHYSMREAVDEIRRQWQEIDHLHYRIRKLEASQAQRVPLSDAQAWEVINATHNLEHFDPYEHNALFEVVRATESAHGITQEKQG